MMENMMKHYYNIQRKQNADGAQGYVVTACCSRPKCGHKKGAIVALKIVRRYTLLKEYLS